MSTLSKELQNAINDQINAEISSAYLYLAMSACAQSMGYSGMGKWLRIQWQEELSHAMKFLDYVHDRGGSVALQAVERPPVKFKSPLDIFQQVLAHEQKVTGLIDHLCGAAVKEHDYATQYALQWFINEQVEEEKNAGEIVQQLKMVGESGPSLIMLDRVLGARGS